jgi:predicted lipoprotein with Yx(FWY)xxD motif
MIPSRPLTFFTGAAVVPLAALAVAGCGGSSTSSAPAVEVATPAKTTSKPAVSVGVRTTPLGKILVDSRGRTLYLFQKDKGSKSTCTGACASAWPPLRATRKPTAGSGARASLISTTSRSDGAPQVTYHGHPLYLFTGDQKAGDTSGQGVNAFGALWYTVTSAGNTNIHRAKSGGGHASASKPAAPAAPKPAAPATTTPKSAPAPAPKPAPKAAKPSIPQNGGGDGDADNNGGPDDGDGGV